MKVVIYAWVLTYGMAYVVVQFKNIIGLTIISDNVAVIGYLLILVLAILKYFGINEIAKCFNILQRNIIDWCEKSKSERNKH